MSKPQRGLRVPATLLSLLAAGLIGGLNSPSTLYAQHAGCRTCSQSAPVVHTQPTPVYVASSASCGCKSCRKKAVSPQCDCQFCELEVKKGEAEKTRYKIEQKEVCVPAVRLPWKKGCPPKRSKVRTVNVLKKEKYKIPKCEYKWKVHEPEDFKDGETAGKGKAADQGTSHANGVALTPEELKEFNLQPGEKIISVISNPSEALGDVPRPPIETQ